jgi:hypothetical protein
VNGVETALERKEVQSKRGEVRGWRHSMRKQTLLTWQTQKRSMLDDELDDFSI